MCQFDVQDIESEPESEQEPEIRVEEVDSQETTEDPEESREWEPARVPVTL